MPQRERAIGQPQSPSEATATERTQAAIQILDTWLREDSPTFGERLFRSGEPDSWEQLKAELDHDRPSDRKLFR
jgi:hypothetical protein